jgi:hypothetical protein
MGDQKGQRENHEDRPATQATSLRLEPQVLNRGPLGLNAMALPTALNIGFTSFIHPVSIAEWPTASP